MKANQYITKKTSVEEIFNHDKDTIAIYEKVLELFLEAGYYRVRISTLPPFDKVLGGLAWILTGCYYDVDIDFKDDMTMAEKIKVSEKVIEGLTSIKCPYIINPAQILNLDVKSILQILNFLVKRLLEVRDERNAMNQKQASRYIKDKTDIEIKPNEDNEEIEEEIKKEEIITERKFRPKKKYDFEYNEELRIFFDIIEYDLKQDISFQKKLITLLKQKKFINIKSKEKSDKEDALTKEEMKALSDIMNNYFETAANTEKVKTSFIENIINDNMESITNEIEEFQNMQGNEEIDKIKLFVKEKERLEQNKNNLLNQIQNYENEEKMLSEENIQQKEELIKMKEEIEQLKMTLKQNQENKEKLEQKLMDEQINEEKLNFIAEKNKVKEQLKNSINKFKKDCLEEKKIYDAQLKSYEQKIEKLNDEENLSIFNEIDTSYNAELKKNIEKKKKLFEQNKIVNALTRKIQLFPSKLEVIQYRKRFQELYDVINAVSEKSMTVMNKTNMKNTIMELLNNKLQSFISLKNLYKILKNKRDKEDFKVTLLNAFNNINVSINKSNDKLKQMDNDINAYQTELNNLQLYELKYMKLIKEYNKVFNQYSEKIK